MTKDRLSSQLLLYVPGYPRAGDLKHIASGRECSLLLYRQPCHLYWTDALWQTFRFCYHHRLSIAGNCRMCLVEVCPLLQ